MKQDWIEHAIALAREPADFYSGARKILTNRHFTFTRLKLDLVLSDAGFTKSKQSMLVRNYLNQPSVDAALELWEARLKKNKYGSVGISTYNHFKKGNIDGASPRGSVMGPCIQSVVLTLIKKDQVAIDVFYRTTELFKKFPADLVFLRDVLLPPFVTDVAPQRMNFHFANITCHPMYFVTMIPHFKNTIWELDRLKKADKHFFEWTVKWTARYVCPEYSRGIQKFAQALRVQKDALERIGRPTLTALRTYLRDNHPGHRNDYTEEDEE